MNKLKRISIIASLLSFSSLSSAADIGDQYYGLGYGMTTYSENGYSDFKPTALLGKFGEYLTDNVSIEGRFAIGLGDDTQNISGTVVDLSVEIDYLMGVYGVVHTDINSDASAYALLGFSKGKLTATASAPGFTSQTISASADDSGISFGFGVDIGSINIEFTQYLSDSTYDLTSIGIGYNF